MPVLNDIILDGKRTRVRPDSKVNMRASVCINPQGVFSRLNPSQLTEQVLNYIMMITRYRMEEMEPVAAKELLLSVIKDIDGKNEVQDNYTVYNEYLNRLDEAELAEVIQNYNHEQTINRVTTLDFPTLDDNYEKADPPIIDGSGEMG